MAKNQFFELGESLKLPKRQFHEFDLFAITSFLPNFLKFSGTLCSYEIIKIPKICCLLSIVVAAIARSTWCKAWAP